MTAEALSSRVQEPLLASFVGMLENVQAPSTPEEQLYVERMFQAAEQIVPKMEQLEENKNAGRTGGIMVIAKPGKDGYVAIREIGEIKSDGKRTANEKREKYTIFALAKVALLLMNPEWYASSQNLKITQEESLKYYDGTTIPAGAVKIDDDDHVIGFSSFTQEDDESTILASEVDAGYATLEVALWQAIALENERFQAIQPQLLTE